MASASASRLGCNTGTPQVNPTASNRIPCRPVIPTPTSRRTVLRAGPVRIDGKSPLELCGGIPVGTLRRCCVSHRKDKYPDGLPGTNKHTCDDRLTARAQEGCETPTGSAIPTGFQPDDIAKKTLADDCKSRSCRQQRSGRIACSIRISAQQHPRRKEQFNSSHSRLGGQRAVKNPPPSRPIAGRIASFLRRQDGPCWHPAPNAQRRRSQP